MTGATEHEVNGRQIGLALILVNAGSDRRGACRSVKQLRANAANAAQDQDVGSEPHWSFTRATVPTGSRSPLGEPPSVRR